LIGINTAIASKTGQSAGVGFAIPASLVSRVVEQLIKFGRIIRPEIGIQRVYETDDGLLIARLTPNGPAERAGLRGPLRQRRGPFLIIDRSQADLIIEVDGEAVNSADDFLSYIESKHAGDMVTLTIVRGGRKIKTSVELGSDG
jgi:S1-C subfamily serine protease